MHNSTMQYKPRMHPAWRKTAESKSSQDSRLSLTNWASILLDVLSLMSQDIVQDTPTQALAAKAPTSSIIGRGQWMVLAAAFLGWMFDGLEMGVFPLAARPALQDLLHVTGDKLVGQWMGYITALFLIGAACGGLIFGWLGDRIGRVRTMIISVLMYSLFTG